MARSFNEMPRRTQWIVVGLLCAGLILMFYLQFWRANAEQISRLNTQISGLQLEVREMEAIAANLPSLREELQTLEDRLAILGNILPEDYESADLLRGVAAIAALSNLRIRDLEFRDPVPYDFYAESPIQLELTGSYHDLARFFDRIGKFARIINIDDVEINAMREQGVETVEATITAMTFIFLEEQEQEDAAQANSQ